MWTPATTLPPIGVDVLVYSPGMDVIAIASLERWGESLCWESDSDTIAASPLAAVSHWMPLPEPPSR